jgi:hypothetical protein
VNLRLPACHYAAIDDKRDQGIVILDDMRDGGFTFGEPTQPWSVERVAEGLEQQAIWHAATWGASTDEGLGLAVGSTSVRAAAPMLFSEQHVERQRSVPELAPLF